MQCERNGDVWLTEMLDTQHAYVKGAVTAAYQRP